MMNPVCKGESELKVESAESLQVQCPIACGERFVSTRLDSSSLCLDSVRPLSPYICTREAEPYGFS